MFTLIIKFDTKILAALFNILESNSFLFLQDVLSFKVSSIVRQSITPLLISHSETRRILLASKRPGCFIQRKMARKPLQREIESSCII